MRWIRGEPGFREALIGWGRQVRPPSRGMIRLTYGLAIVNVLLLLLAGCSAPWNGKQSTVMPTATAQFAGGEPVLPQLQKLYREAPLPSRSDTTTGEQFWSLAGHDPANTAASTGSPVRGNMQWFFQTPDPVLASPIVADGLALVNGGDGVLYAVDSSTGSLRWQVPAGDTLVAGTPAVADGVVYAAAQGHGLMALNLNTGMPLWKVDTHLPVRAAPMAVGSLLFVMAGANELLCLDRLTGKEYWQFRSEDVLSNFWPSQGLPAVTINDGGLVFVALGASTEFNALSLRTGRKVWEQTMDSRMVGSPVYDAQSGLVFAATWMGHIYAMDSHTGAIKWGYDLPKAGTIGVGLASGPALANETLFIGDYTGRVMALDALNGRPHWIFQGQGSIVASPVVLMANGAGMDVYVANRDGNLTALNGINGSQEWHLYLGELRSAPVLVNGSLFVGSVGEHGLFALN
ncbi:MAG TPA: PQQ-binding-like beta-propeller repeat protein [Ktedonobacteraceae bacterium]